MLKLVLFLGIAVSAGADTVRGILVIQPAGTLSTQQRESLVKSIQSLSPYGNQARILVDRENESENHVGFEVRLPNNARLASSKF